MDYEQKIKALEEDIRHWRTLKELHDERLNAHDRSIAAIHEILAESARIQAETGRMLQDLIKALAGSLNGKH